MKLTLILLASLSVVVAQDTVSATAEACEPHGDHWHCPSGVTEPTTPPAPVAATSVASTLTQVSVISSSASSAAISNAATACEPHGDHWHCPAGVPEPTIPPAPGATSAHDDEHNHDTHSATAATCEPHGDHWHCPSGVPQPTAPPAAVTTTTAAGNVTSSFPSSTSSLFDGSGVAVARKGGAFAAVVGAVGMFFI